MALNYESNPCLMYTYVWTKCLKEICFIIKIKEQLLILTQSVVIVN